MTADIDPYKTLQVDPEAEDEVIQAAYRRLAQKYHPDRRPDAEGAERMVAINAAWEMVRDPAKRAAYDRNRFAAGPTSAAARPAPSSPAPAASQPTAGGAPPPRPREGGGASSARASSDAGSQRPPESVPRDWTSGRSTAGSGYDPRTMRAEEGLGAAGPPPGNPSGTVLKFGRYAGWSLGEIARRDLEYLEWLDRMAVGRAYRDEIDQILRRTGRRRSAAADASERRGLFRRR